MNSVKKFAVVVLAIATIGSFVPATHAQTTAELQAQIQSLLALIAQLQAQLSGGGTTGGGTHTYTQDLTLGSTGADVTALQQFLVSKGFLTMPAGASFGTFGPLTKAALASYQASVGISPAAGYFGPITRAHFNAMVTASPVATPGVSPVPTQSNLQGGEGIITVDTNATPASGAKYYEGDTNVGLLGLKIKAQNSDLSVQRVKVDIGTSVTFYTKAFTNLSLYDGSTLLKSVDLNSDSVVKEGTRYFVYFSDLNVFVGQDTTKVLTIDGSVMGTVAAAYVAQTIIIPLNGVRAVDAAGLTQAAPAAPITRNITISSAITDSVQLIMSKDSNTPVAQNIVSDSQGSVEEATVGVLDFKAKNDLVKVDQLTLDVNGSATPTAVFLYDGSTLISSASVTAGAVSTNTSNVLGNGAAFTDMEDNFQIAKDATKAITVKVSYSGANSTAATSSVSISTVAHVTAYNSQGIAVDGTGNTTISGTPASNIMTIVSAGPVFSLQSAVATHQDGIQGVSSSSVNGAFTINVTAAGGDMFFTTTSTLPLGVATGNLLAVYNGDTKLGAATNTNITFSSAFTTPVAGVRELAEGQTGTITITGVAYASEVTGAFVNFKLSGIVWGTDADLAIAGATNTAFDTTDFVTAPLWSLQ